MIVSLVVNNEGPVPNSATENSCTNCYYAIAFINCVGGLLKTKHHHFTCIKHRIAIAWSLAFHTALNLMYSTGFAKPIQSCGPVQHISTPKALASSHAELDLLLTTITI